MGIGKRKGSGVIVPHIKYDARSGVVYRCDREQAPNGEWYTSQANITDFAAVFDMAGIETGWIAFASGTPPNFAVVPVGQQIGNQPSDKHKQGFRLKLKLAKSCGGDLREFSSTSVAAWSAIDKLHDEFQRESAKHPGKLPLVRLTEVKPNKTVMGTTYTPVFTIASWVERPAELTTAPPHVADPTDEVPDFDDEAVA